MPHTAGGISGLAATTVSFWWTLLAHVLFSKKKSSQSSPLCFEWCKKHKHNRNMKLSWISVKLLQFRQQKKKRKHVHRLIRDEIKSFIRKLSIKKSPLSAPSNSNQQQKQRKAAKKRIKTCMLVWMQLPVPIQLSFCTADTVADRARASTTVENSWKSMEPSVLRSTSAKTCGVSLLNS